MCRRRLVSFGLERVSCCIAIFRVHSILPRPTAVLCDIQVLESLEGSSEQEEHWVRIRTTSVTIKLLLNDFLFRFVSSWVSVPPGIKIFVGIFLFVFSLYNFLLVLVCLMRCLGWFLLDLVGALAVFDGLYFQYYHLLYHFYLVFSPLSLRVRTSLEKYLFRICLSFLLVLLFLVDSCMTL